MLRDIETHIIGSPGAWLRRLLGQAEPEAITVRVGRDNVAIGEDLFSHRHEMAVPSGMKLRELLELARPNVCIRGWAWVVEVDSVTTAVWSADGGVRLLVDDVPLEPGSAPLEIRLRYFPRTDPEWLYWELRGGTEPDPRALEAAFEALTEIP